MKKNCFSASWHICIRMWCLEVWQPFGNDEERSLSVKVSMLRMAEQRDWRKPRSFPELLTHQINHFQNYSISGLLIEIINLVLFKLPLGGSSHLLEIKINRCRKEYYRCWHLKLSYNFWSDNSALAIMQSNHHWKNSGSKLLQIFSYLEYSWQVCWVPQISAILVFLFSFRFGVKSFIVDTC